MSESQNEAKEEIGIALEKGKVAFYHTCDEAKSIAENQRELSLTNKQISTAKALVFGLEGSTTTGIEGETKLILESDKSLPEKAKKIGELFGKTFKKSQEETADSVMITNVVIEGYISGFLLSLKESIDQPCVSYETKQFLREVSSVFRSIAPPQK